MKKPLKAKNRRLPCFLKRCVDVLGATMLVLLFSVVFLVVGILVMIMDGRPVIYRRRVVGMGGQFDAFKFRTMVRNADAVLKCNPALNAEFSRNFKLQNDPRVTRLGAYLRKLSLDELPQLFNVLRGQMSLVGPSGTRKVRCASATRYVCKARTNWFLAGPRPAERLLP
jgi:exopolysaccharide production protein ExoY